MYLCRFHTSDGEVRVGLLERAHAAELLDLTDAGIDGLGTLLESADLLPELRRLSREHVRKQSIAAMKLLPPIEAQEVWAAGVTYLRSRQARMEESEFSANAYDRVYEAARPELFFKSAAEKVVAPGEPVGIRSDGRWNVPEPELALVFNSRRDLVGFTVGNDMSSRDIEGENLLYLPQAKVYHRSCALGPWIRVGTTEEDARSWKIILVIQRRGQTIFQGETKVANIKRSFSELGEYLFRCQQFPNGAVLLTGTGIVPPDDFTLEANDSVSMEISGIGKLTNPVMVV